MPRERKTLVFSGPNLWYLVGLIASDGCLSRDGRHVDITSKDPEFLEELREDLKIANRIGFKNHGAKNQAYHIQLANKHFYEFLVKVGLMPAKSLVLKSLDEPEKFFADFLRGLIDGDGCIRSWFHSSNLKEQWSLRIYSGSKDFLSWLEDKILEFFKARGRCHVNDKRNSVYVLKYGKMAAQTILRQCYYNGCFGYERKRKLADECLCSRGRWRRSKTIKRIVRNDFAGMLEWQTMRT